MTGIKQPLGAKKYLGQHFLRDMSVIEKIIAAIPFAEAKKIIEVGPGRGALTESLYAALQAQGRARDLVLVELDADLLEDLRTHFPEATLIHADATKSNWQEITSGASWVLVGNLPYNAGTAIVNEAFWSIHPPVAAVVMLQKEVGERMLALPPNMSVLSVAMQVKTKGNRVCLVKPGAFVPPPKVDSVVIALRGQTRYSPEESQQIIALAKKGFAHPRKQLRQTLGGKDESLREAIGNVLAAHNLSPLARPEELSIEVWKALVESKK
jgi:16S rRNA (adenine1518-N6/adenine1519-N6)-dimethyltransferase